jgi:hypothetical protein
MPIPEKKDNEKQNDFMNRCMHSLREDKIPNNQKVAICLNTFSHPKNKSKATDKYGIEIDFSDKIKEKKDQEQEGKQVKAEPIVEKKIEIPVLIDEIKVKSPLPEPTNTAVTAPAEDVNKVEVEEVKAAEIKAEVDGELIQTAMLQMQKQYQIFHWQTASFSQHKSFGKIYESLDENIDTFIETYMGKYGRITSASKFNLEMSNYSDLNFINATDSYIEFLINLTNTLDSSRDTDLLNTRDEILGSLNRLKYLLTLA